jgi:hypothetical protein
MTPSPLRNASLFCVAVGIFSATSAQAHFSLELAGSYLSREGGDPGDLKGSPCGLPNTPRGDHIYTFEPGQTITLSVDEYIPHPSYFRISFDPNGQHFKEPASIKPIDPTRPCPFNAADQCGKSDFYNSPLVLMDNLNPHLATASPPPYTWQVKLPDVECDNCTIQILQVMEDTIHGAYNPTPGNPADVPYVEDIYHQCIDVVLKKGGHGPDADGGPHFLPRVPFDGGTVTGEMTPVNEPPSEPASGASKSSSSCTVSRANGSNSTAELVALGAGLAVLTARRRRARR